MHIGAFKLPANPVGSPSDAQYSFDYGGKALGYNPANNSIFISGHAQRQNVAEIRIPDNVSYSNFENLSTGNIIQGLSDPLEGRINEINPLDSNPKRIGGFLAHNNQLIISAVSTYDANGSQQSSHFLRPMTMNITGQLQGPIRIPGNVNPRWLGGYMSHIPAEWQESLGGSAFSGIGGMSIASTSSVGPAMAIINPDRIAESAAKLLIGYPLSSNLAALYGYRFEDANPVFNPTSEVRGAVFPSGTRSVLFFGKNGLGNQMCYGDGSTCNDPANSYKSYHAYPYAYQVWAYDALDLADVAKGVKEPNRIKPYAIWNFNLPFEENEPLREIGGAVYDPAKKRIYISQRGAYKIGYVNQPLIQVLELR